MGQSAFRRTVSCVLVFLFPAAMYAADSNAAMLYTELSAISSQPLAKLIWGPAPSCL